MKKATTIIAEAGESGGLADPLQETPDGEVHKLGRLVARAPNGNRKAGGRLKEMGTDVEAAQGPHFSASINVKEKNHG